MCGVCCTLYEASLLLSTWCLESGTRGVWERKAPMHARGEVFTSRECHLPWFVVIAVQGVLRRRKVKSAGGVAVSDENHKSSTRRS